MEDYESEIIKFKDIEFIYHLIDKPIIVKEHKFQKSTLFSQFKNTKEIKMNLFEIML